MGLLNIIRRMALREKLPLREIARRTGMSRNTIKKYLIPTCTDQHSCAHLRIPMDLMRAGWLISLFQASQQ